MVTGFNCDNDSEQIKKKLNQVSCVRMPVIDITLFRWRQKVNKQIERLYSLTCGWRKPSHSLKPDWQVIQVASTSCRANSSSPLEMPVLWRPVCVFSCLCFRRVLQASCGRNMCTACNRLWQCSRWLGFKMSLWGLSQSREKYWCLKVLLLLMSIIRYEPRESRSLLIGI